MGIETILFAAFTGLKAISQMNAAEAQAKETVKEGNLAASQEAIKVKYAAAKQTASFLSSGITLEGTPMDVVNETFKTGQQDIDNIRQNYDSKAKQQISSGRSQAIGTIVGGFAGASTGGSIGSMFDTGLSYAPESTLTGLNGSFLTNDAYDALEIKDARV